MTTPQAVVDPPGFVTLTDDQHTTPVERALERAAGHRMSSIMPSPPWDYEGISESTLAYLAETLSTDAWTAALADLSYRRQVVLDSIYINRFRGTRPALERFANRAGFVIRYVLHRDDSDTRNASVDIYITPTVYEHSSVDWVDYVARVILGLLPLGISINFITVTPRATLRLFTGAVLRARHKVVLSGTN